MEKTGLLFIIYATSAGAALRQIKCAGCRPRARKPRGKRIVSRRANGGVLVKSPFNRDLTRSHSRSAFGGGNPGAVALASATVLEIMWRGYVIPLDAGENHSHIGRVRDGLPPSSFDRPVPVTPGRAFSFLCRLSRGWRLVARGYSCGTFLPCADKATIREMRAARVSLRFAA